MVFCNIDKVIEDNTEREVTILILIDGFLQFGATSPIFFCLLSHNPYFNRWFSAINTDKLFIGVPLSSQSLF